MNRHRFKFWRAGPFRAWASALDRRIAVGMSLGSWEVEIMGPRYLGERHRRALREAEELAALTAWAALSGEAESPAHAPGHGRCRRAGTVNVGWISSAVQSEDEVQRLYPIPEWRDEYDTDPVFIMGPRPWPEFILVTRSRRRGSELVRISTTMYYPPRDAGA